MAHAADVVAFGSAGVAAVKGLLPVNLIVRAAAAAELTADTPAKHRAHGSSHGHFDFPFSGTVQGCSPGWSHTSQDSGQIRARLMSAKRPVYSGAPQNPGANQRGRAKTFRCATHAVLVAAKSGKPKKIQAAPQPLALRAYPWISG